MLQLSHSEIEERIKRQLVEAILFEGLLPFQESRAENDSKFDTYYFVQGISLIFQCQGRRSAFDRIRVKTGTISKNDEKGNKHNVTLKELVMQITDDSQTRAKLFHELQQTLLFSEWNEKHVNLLPSRRQLTYEELESALIEGHPYHPCFKARTGFSMEDHQAFGPEAGHSFQLWWTALPKSKVKRVFPTNEVDFWKKELGQETYQVLMERMVQKGGNPGEYCLFLVHPWQWKFLSDSAAVDQEIIPLGKAGDFYRATQSVRTLFNASDLLKGHIKLSMNIVNTSSLRTIEEHSVCTAPVISEWLQRVKEIDTYLNENDRVVFLQEYAGAIYQSSTMESNGQLAVIWRESVRGALRPGEEAVPFNALSLMERDGQPFISQWVKKYGIEKWLLQLFEVAVLPVWHLLATHGIGVEAHGQNMVLIHKDGWPTRLILRDFHESLEYKKSYLKNPELSPDFEKLNPVYKEAPEDSYYWMSTVEALRELVMDTLFVFQFSELSYLFEDYYSLPEDDFWRSLYDLIKQHIKKNPELMTRHNDLRIYKEKIRVESLFTKKIKKEYLEYHHMVTNSIAVRKNNGKGDEDYCSI